MTPPQPLSYLPNNFEIEFTRSSFTIEFDEYIQVTDLSGQLIISPPLSKTPEYNLRGKSLEIQWEEELLPNTTYQFNFGKSVKDLNEGNVNPDLQYVFSTGSYLDSLEISGRAINAEDNEPLQNAAVLIYKNLADSMPRTSPPDYFNLTDVNGNFKLRYLPAGDFKLFVLFEENNNYVYDGPPERIGYLADAIQSGLDSLPRPQIVTFIENDTSQYISSSKGRDYGRYNVVFNVPTTEASIIFIDTETNEKLEAISFLNERKDTLQNWVTLPKQSDFEEATVIVRDGAFVDTSFWYIETDKDFREKAELTLNSNTTQSKLNLTHEFTLNFNNPIVEADTAIIYFLEDSVRVFPTDFHRSNLNRTFKVGFPFKKESFYIFKAKAGAFKDVFESYNDSVSIPFSLQDNDYYGNLSVKIFLPDSISDTTTPKLLQFYTDKNKLIEQIPFTSELSKNFERLDPGKYLLKVVYDENNDGKWNTGNYSNGDQPERISIYPEEIQIRSNWDFEVEWAPTLPL